MLAAGLNYDAGRAAYLAAFHAAQAIVFERSGKVVKTHKGVNIEFLRLTKDDPAFTPDQRGFLSPAYDFKAVADYDTGPITKQVMGRAVGGQPSPRSILQAVVKPVIAG